MIQKAIVSGVLALGIAAIPLVVHAAPEMAKQAHIAASSNGFLEFHPDLRWRKEGLRQYEAGAHADAFAAFKRSARYSDKGSQAMVGQMYWNGEGVDANRPAAYAWLDLAAERGYIEFLTLREQYWARLSESERSEALAMGKEIYAEYGDDVAKPRLVQMLNRGRKSTTGSRTGFRGALTVLIPGNGNWISLDGEQYYNDVYWKPEQYFKWQDQIWKDNARGHVEVGALSTDTPPKPPTE